MAAAAAAAQTTGSQEKILHIRDLGGSSSSPTSSSTAAAAAQSPRVKPPPKSGRGKISVPFTYIPSGDGTDENLLILLHGLGDTHEPFAKLGKQLNLPQTAVLVLRAPERIPYLLDDEEAYQWYTSFNLLGELIPNPNPTPALELLNQTVVHLTTECQWPLDRIHWFGFAQGGSVAVEFGLWWWKEEKKKQLSKGSSTTTTTGSEAAAATAGQPTSSFGSIITIAGPLVSYPSSSSSTSTPNSSSSPTPLLSISRPTPSEFTFKPSDISAFKKGYRIFKEEKYGNAKGGGMPVGREEWEVIMRFWSERLSRRRVVAAEGGGGGGLYEVLSGFS